MKSPSAVLYGHGGVENRGCEAIVRTTTALLLEQRPDASVALCSERPQSDREAGLPGISRIISHRLVPVSVNRLLYSVKGRLGVDQDALRRQIQAPVIRAIRKADIALSIGGDTYCYNPPQELYAIHSALRGGGPPRVLWACSVDPERLAGKVLEDLRGYDMLFARESITHQALLAQNLPSLRCCDPAFTMIPEEVPLPQGFLPGRTVGLNLSPLALRHAAAGQDLMPAALKLVRHILDTSEDAVALIPHVTWAHDNDLDVLLQIRQAFGEEPRILLLPGTHTAPQLKYLISNLRVLIAARTHASIAAYSSGVPALVLGYSVKARGIARDLLDDIQGALLPVQGLHNGSQWIDAYTALLAGAQTQRELLAQRLPEYTQLAHRAMAQVARIAGWRHE